MLSHVVGAASSRTARVEVTAAGRVAEQAIHSIAICYPDILVDHYVIMPNHIHLLLSVRHPLGRRVAAPTVSTVIQRMKGYVTRQLGEAIWQKSFHDHVIRCEEDYQMIWNYIDTNPTRWEMDRFYQEDGTWKNNL